MRAQSASVSSRRSISLDRAVRSTVESLETRRLLSSGQLDNSWGKPSIVQTDFNGSTDVMLGSAQLNDGRYVGVGYSSAGVGGQNFAVVQYLSDGTLDPTFGVGGKVEIDFAGSTDTAYDVAIQGDGKIVVAGAVTTDGGGADFGVARLNANGTLDTTFGNGGKKTTSFGTGSNDAAFSIVIQPDGKIVLGGYGNGTGGRDFALVRYTTTGALDTSFGSQGRSTMDFGSTDEIRDLVRQADGKFVAVGISYVITGGAFAVGRFTANGGADNGFDSDGKQTVDFGLSTDFGNSIALQSDGKIVVAGYATDTTLNQSDFAVARLNAGGSLDTNFSGDGKATFAVSKTADVANVVKIQSDGKIVLGGSSRPDSNQANNAAVIRITSAATLDTSFAVGGIYEQDWFGGTDDYVNTLLLQNDGRIFLGGQSQPNSWQLISTRLLADGSSDPLYGRGDGVTGLPTGFKRQTIASALQADGKLVTVGLAEVINNGHDVLLQRFNVDGTLDTTFGVGGRVLTDYSPGYATSEFANAVVIQPDGKIVVAGNANNRPATFNDMFAARYNTNGSVDTSFGTAGVTFINFFNSQDEAYGIALQGTKFIVVGRAYTGSSYDAAVARLSSNGNLDSSFDADGKFTFDFGTLNGDDQINAVAIDAASKVVVTGYSNGGPNGYDFAVARINLNGGLDNTFDTDGKKLIPIGVTTNTDDSHAIAIQTDGKIVLGGYGQGLPGGRDFALVRLNTTGSLDTSFSTDGIANADFFGSNDTINSIAIVGGKIIAAGSAYNNANTNDFAVARFNSNGALDTTFDTDGKQTADLNNNGGKDDQARSVVVQTDGKILVSGYTYTQGNFYDNYVVRLNSSGSFDTTYAGAGKNVQSNEFNGYITASALQSDGKLVVAGTTDGSGINSSDFFVQRFNVDGTLDTTFGARGRTYTDFFQNQDFAQAVAIQPDGKIVVAGRVINPISGGWNFGLVRYNSNGTIDTTFGSAGKVNTDFANTTDYAYGVAIQANGKIVAAGLTGQFGNDFAIARYNTNGTLDGGFDGDGKANYDFGSSTQDEAAAVAIEAATQKIVLAGWRRTGAASGDDIALMRLNPSGSLDNTFGLGGRVVSDLSPGDGYAERATSIALQSSGKVIIGGWSNVAGSQDFLAARYNNSGSLDTTYGSNGYTAVDFGSTNDIANAVALQGDGGVVLAGHVSNITDYGIAKLLPNGQIDTTFGPGGKLRNDLFGQSNQAFTTVQVQRDGRILTAGYSTSPFGGNTQVVQRYFGDQVYRSSGGRLTVWGDGRPDNITIASTGGNTTVTLNGAPTVFSDASINAIDVFGLGATDIVTLTGTTKAASIFGGTENDSLVGGGGNDSLFGEDGFDALDGGLSADQISGGKQNDTISYALRTAAVNVSLDGVANDGAVGELDNVGIDVETVLGGSGNDTLTGNASTNRLVGNGGNDVLDGGLSSDVLVGGDGLDTANYSSRTANLVITLDGAANDGVAGENDNVNSDIETVLGGSGNDSLVGAAGVANRLVGNGGNDTLGGGGGETDTLDGGTGTDTLTGSNAGDLLISVP